MRVIVLVSCAVGMVFCSACIDNKAVDTSGVDELAKTLLDAIATGNAQDFYEKYFTKEYRNRTSATKWQSDVELYRQRLGKVQNIERILAEESTSIIEGQAEGVFNFKVRWEKSGGSLRLALTKTPQGWKITSLQIFSPALQSNENDPLRWKPGLTSEVEEAGID